MMPRPLVEDLYKILVKEYGQAAVFRDTKSEEPGDRFPDLLRAEIEKATVVLVVIGSHWSRRGENGKSDWLVEEVKLALAQGKKIIPVVVEDAAFPPKNLPPAIEDLAHCVAAFLPPASFRAEARRLAIALAGKAESEPISTTNLPRLQLEESREVHRGRVTSLLWPADGSSPVSASEDGSVVWWKGRTRFARGGHQSPVRALAFVSEPKLVVSLSADRRCIWSYSSGELRWETRLPFADKDFSAFAVSPTKRVVRGRADR